MQDGQSGHEEGPGNGTIRSHRVKSHRIVKAGGIGCLFFVTLFWSAITLLFDVLVAWFAFQQIQALRYATAAGTIMDRTVVTEDGDEGPTYRPVIRYKYTVAGKEYQGGRYRYGQWSSSGGAADRLVARYPAGSQVEVYYASGDPSDAVLKAGLDGWDLFFAMFLLPFNLVMVGLWMGLGWGIAGGRGQVRAGGTQLWNEGRSWDWQSSRARLYRGTAVAGALAFGLTFPIGFGFGFNPPLFVMLVAWGAILCGGTVACFRRQSFSHQL